MEKGRNLWGSNPKRAETSGNPLTPHFKRQRHQRKLEHKIFTQEWQWKIIIQLEWLMYFVKFIHACSSCFVSWSSQRRYDVVSTFFSLWSSRMKACVALPVVDHIMDNIRKRPPSVRDSTGLYIGYDENRCSEWKPMFRFSQRPHRQAKKGFPASQLGASTSYILFLTDLFIVIPIHYYWEI